MKLVVDTNTIISALVKNSTSRKIFNNLNFNFITPDFTIEELSKYKGEVCRKAKIDAGTFDILIGLLFYRIEVVAFSEYGDSIEESENLIGIYDKKDIPFLALAISKKVDGIWSDDKHFKKQNKVGVFKTKELIE